MSGSAGTGKTIVALHRAVHLARAHSDARVLLTTFSTALADALRARVVRLIAMSRTSPNGWRCTRWPTSGGGSIKRTSAAPIWRPPTGCASCCARPPPRSKTSGSACVSCGPSGAASSTPGNSQAGNSIGTCRGSAGGLAFPNGSGSSSGRFSPRWPPLWTSTGF